MTDTSEEVRCFDCDFTTTVYSDEVRAFYRFHTCHPPQERAILTDLIDEQRELHHRTTLRGLPFCSLCNLERWPCQCVESLDRAEARLREVQRVSDDIAGLAHAMLDAELEKGDTTPTGWRVSPGTAVRIADYYGIEIGIPEDLTSFQGLPVMVDTTCVGISLMIERPGIRVAHNDPISDTPERILVDLIAELRSENEWHYTAMANRAEARLKGLTDE